MQGSHGTFQRLRRMCQVVLSHSLSKSQVTHKMCQVKDNRNLDSERRELRLSAFDSVVHL